MPQFEIPDPVEKAVQEYLCPMPKTTEKLRTICKFVLFSNPDDHGGGPLKMNVSDGCRSGRLPLKKRSIARISKAFAPFLKYRLIEPSYCLPVLVTNRYFKQGGCNAR